MAQIGTVKLQTQNSGVVDVPVFETGDSASGVFEFVRVETASGTGFIPVTDPADATYPYLRVQSQNNGIVAVTDTAGADIPDTLVDNFENEPDGPYEEGDSVSKFYTGTFEDRTEGESLTGEFALHADGIGGDEILSFPGDGLPNYFTQGERCAYYFRDENGQNASRFTFAAEDGDNCARIGLHPGSDDFFLEKRIGGSNIQLDSTSLSLSVGEWYEVVVIWHDGSSDEDNNEIVVEVYEVDQNNGERGDELATVSANEDDVEGNDGYGFSAVSGSSDEDYYDDVRVEPL